MVGSHNSRSVVGILGRSNSIKMSRLLGSVTYENDNSMLTESIEEYAITT